MNELKSLSILSEQLDGWTITTFVLQFPLSDVKPPVSVLGFAAQVASNRVVFEIPYWFLVLFCAAITALVLFKLRPRFSIRLLLVAMTLFATVLGIAVARNNQ